MYIDGNMQFGLPAITNSTVRTISTNVFDSDQTGAAEAATPAVRLFASPKVARLVFRTAITADGGTISIRVEFIGADNAALTTLPVLLADTGIILTDEGGAALATGDIVDVALQISGQTAAKRFYGCFVTLGGTNPDIVAAASQLFIALDSQTNQPGNQVAVPST